VRHRVYGKHLSRDKNQRTALFKSLVGSLFIHGHIETTETKAKAVKGLVDKIINQAKSKDTQRLVTAYLVNKQIQEKLIKEIVPVLKDRNSGYTSIVKLGNRLGDGAMVVRMQLLGEVINGLPEKKAKVEPKEAKEEKAAVIKAEATAHIEEKAVKKETKPAKKAVKK
jgi:large subunit ribosomal protein L17